MPSPAPALSRVLCATDLSEFGNRAVPFAFAIVAPQGRVTLLHVLRTPELPSPLVPHYGERHASESELAKQERDAEARLASLARAPADARGAAFDVVVRRASDVVRGILDEAELLRVDAICVATHSRTGLAQLVLGSTAHEVLHRGGRPVLLVPSPVAR